MSPKVCTSATRLHEFVTKTLGRHPDTWLHHFLADALGVPYWDMRRLHRKLELLGLLLEDTRTQVDVLKPGGYEKVLQQLDDLARVFYQTNLDQPYSRIVAPGQLALLDVALDHVEEVMSKASTTEYYVDSGCRVALGGMLTHVKDELSGSSYPRDIKQILQKLIGTMERALDDYGLRGEIALREAAAIIRDSMSANESRLNREQHRNGGAVKRILQAIPAFYMLTKVAQGISDLVPIVIDSVSNVVDVALNGRPADTARVVVQELDLDSERQPALVGESEDVHGNES